MNRIEANTSPARSLLEILQLNFQDFWITPNSYMLDNGNGEQAGAELGQAQYKIG